jgi:hypothetical protein
MSFEILFGAEDELGNGDSMHGLRNWFDDSGTEIIIQKRVIE